MEPEQAGPRVGVVVVAADDGFVDVVLNRSPDQPLTLTNFQAQRFVLYLVSNFPPLGTVTPPSPPNPSSPIKKAII